MMSNRYTRKIVEDLVVEGVDAGAVDHLMDIAAYAIERIAPTLARSATFELTDFASAERRGVSGFALTLTRESVIEHEMWEAEFTRGDGRVRAPLAAEQPN